MRCCGRAGLEIVEPLPGLEVLRAGDAALGDGGGQVAARGVGVLALGAEQAVDPAVLVPDETHVVHVDVGVGRLGHDHRVIPEAEPVDAGRAFGDGEEALAVGAFDAGRQIDLAVQLDGAGIEGAVDAQPLHQVRIGLVVQIVPPEDRRVLGRQHRVLVAVEHAVAALGDPVGPVDESLVLGQ